MNHPFDANIHVNLVPIKYVEMVTSFKTFQQLHKITIFLFNSHRYIDIVSSPNHKSFLGKNITYLYINNIYLYKLFSMICPRMLCVYDIFYKKVCLD